MKTRNLSGEYPGVEFIELTGPVKVFPNVTIGPGSVVYGPCVLGHPPYRKEPGELPLVIGANSVIRTGTVIYAGSTMGDRLQTGHYTVIREEHTFGDDCSVGSHVGLEVGNWYGNGVRVHTNAAMSGATLADGVWVGPGALLLDDPHAPCPRSRDCIGGAKVKSFAVIGAGATVMAGVTVGRRSVVAAGALVIKDVPDEVLVVGSPARVLKRIDELECWTNFYERPYIWSEGEGVSQR